MHKLTIDGAGGIGLDNTHKVETLTRNFPTLFCEMGRSFQLSNIHFQRGGTRESSKFSHRTLLCYSSMLILITFICIFQQNIVKLTIEGDTNCAQKLLPGAPLLEKQNGEASTSVFWNLSSIPLSDIYEEIAKYRENREKAPLVVNIGASSYDESDRHYDPTYSLIDAGWKGIYVDGDAQGLHIVSQQFPKADILFLAENLTPTTVSRVLNQAKLLFKEFELLKIDVDSIDCLLLQEFLLHSKPMLIQIELNAEIPYPIKFSVLPNINDRNISEVRNQVGKGIFGCSLAYIDAIAARHGYEVLQFSREPQGLGHDVILTSTEFAGRLRQSFQLPKSILDVSRQMLSDTTSYPHRCAHFTGRCHCQKLRNMTLYQLMPLLFECITNKTSEPFLLSD